MLLAWSRISRGIRSRGFDIRKNKITGATVLYATGEIKKINCEKAIICSGAWSKKIFSKIPVFPVKGQMLSIQGPTNFLKRVIFGPKTYLVPRDDGLIIVGATVRKRFKNLIVMGDFNVSPENIDIGIGEQNAKRWLREGKTSFQPQEREMWNSIKNLGFVDSWRVINPNESSIYSWFDYRSRMFDQNPKRGLRIDHILLSENLKSSINLVGIDYDARAMEKPSDHCPVWLELNE